MHKQTTKSCTVNVTVNRNRLKMYGDAAFLKDGQNFEIELFNPHQETHLAKISINGINISQSGIVLKPGERIFLERFIDEDRKFLFEIYDVENTQESKRAIANNGSIVVTFYPEYKPFNLSNIVTSTYIYNPTITLGGTTTGNLSYVNTNGSFTSAGTTLTTTGNISGSSFTLNSVSNSVAGSLETGRVEKGEKSDQNFENYYGNFSPFHSEIVNLKLLPASLKPIEKKEIRSYCTECGTRMKKQNWKFCPNCGTKAS